MLRYVKRYLFASALIALVGWATPRVAHGSSFGRVVVRSYVHSGMVFAGRLLSPSGFPVAHQPVLVWGGPLGGGPGGWVGGTYSNGSGYYWLHVSRGANRALTVGAGPYGTQVVDELVAPNLWITVRRRRGGVMFTGGIIASRHLPLPVVLIQDRTPGGWRTFGAVQPNWYSHRWRFWYPDSSHGTFAFRASNLPGTFYIAGGSKVKYARV